MTNRSFESSSPALATAGKIIGLLLFFLLLFGPTPAGLSVAATRLAAVIVLMAAFWLTQAIPIVATSLIPLVTFPLLGVQSARSVSRSYINENVFLFLGGFVIALGIEKWGLHRRMALHIVRLLGTGGRRVVLGFMAATAFLSMWISNTASTLLMLPIGLALITSLRELAADNENDVSDVPSTRQAEGSIDKFSTVLMLGIAYSASIGGLTTLVGTPTNVVFQEVWHTEFPAAPELSAGEWMTAVVPLGFVLLLCAWGVLVWRMPAFTEIERFDRGYFTQKIRALGPLRRAELLMSIVFATTAFLWILRKPLRIGSTTLLPGWGASMEEVLLQMQVDPTLVGHWLHDSTVAMGMALVMFFIPAERDTNGQTQYLMDWQTVEKMPWGILLLIGGGFAIAGAFSETGLSQWIGQYYAHAIENWPAWMIVATTCSLLTFLTELTSNVATVSALLPILAGAAVTLRIDPRLVMMPAAISASCAFMLPIATPPNAIIFGSGHVRMGQMFRYGMLLNLLGVVLITAATFLLLVPQLGISLDAADGGR